MVSKLDRLSRSVVDSATLMERSKRNGWALVVLDLGVDTTTASGKLAANVMASVGEWEREVISERTREALRARRAEGVTLGRPKRIPPEVTARIKRWRRRGLSLPKIAAKLNETGVPTAQGGRQHYPSTVRAALGG